MKKNPSPLEINETLRRHYGSLLKAARAFGKTVPELTKAIMNRDPVIYNEARQLQGQKECA